MIDYTGNDIYCDQIIPKTIDIQIVEETENVLAFHHTKPFWPVHIVIVPKWHVDSLLELEGDQEKELLAVLKRVARKIKEEQGSARVLTNLGGYQDSKHLHFHVLSGDKLVA